MPSSPKAPARRQPVAKVAAVAPGAAAEQAGIEEGDEILALNGHPVRDVIEYARATDGTTVEVTLRRGGQGSAEVVSVGKEAGLPLGLEVASPVFDRVRTCDNHCSFCFIHQLPKGLRRSLYVKDDDYRLSFLYGNFTTLTRFTELDVERVIDERLSPLYVSIHATDPEVRAQLLRNPRGATSLRWLEVLLDHGVEVHGQVVVCPGVNDGAVLEGTLCDVLDRYPGLASVGVVPLGISRYTTEAELREHSAGLAEEVVDTVERWQATFAALLGRRMVFCADEYYLLARRRFPPASSYEGFVQHENGIGMARALIDALAGPGTESRPTKAGFFASVDGAPPAGYRALRASDHTHKSGSRNHTPVTVVTGRYGEAVLAPLLASLPGGQGIRVLGVDNRFFGGNISVAGLLTGGDVGAALAEQPADHRYLLPDSCLSEGRFLDGTTLADLPRRVEVVPTDGASLRRALGLDHHPAVAMGSSS